MFKSALESWLKRSAQIWPLSDIMPSSAPPSGELAGCTQMRVKLVQLIFAVIQNELSGLRSIIDKMFLQNSFKTSFLIEILQKLNTRKKFLVINYRIVI